MLLTSFDLFRLAKDFFDTKNVSQTLDAGSLYNGGNGYAASALLFSNENIVLDNTNSFIFLSPKSTDHDSCIVTAICRVTNSRVWL